MGRSFKQSHPLLTFCLIFAGIVAGSWIGPKFADFLSGTQSGKLFGFIPLSELRVRGPLSTRERATLFAAFTMLGAILGYLVSAPIYGFLYKIRTNVEKMSPQEKLALFFGLVIGLILTVLISASLHPNVWVNLIIAIVMSYLGVVAALSMKDELRLGPAVQVKKSEEITLGKPKILDTNVIIDGRIADICRAGFLDGPIMVPQFVLDELQQIADSNDSLKRARGRRGLDILNQMRKDTTLHIQQYPNDSGNGGEEVDTKLVKMAIDARGVIVTNDYNLNKVAELQGVRVLNVNELANALKPVVLPGEEMKVTIIKEGKESNQGIGYLDDGTMIVVEQGRKYIGETLDVVVTSVLQTVAGKMIFASPLDEVEEEVESFERNDRADRSGGTRRKIR